MSSRARSPLSSCVMAALCVSALSGCAVGADFIQPENMLAKTELAAREDYGLTREVVDDDVPVEWWTLFGDSTLTQLQTRAQLGNLDVQIAAERIEQSRAQFGIVSSQLWPALSSGVGYAREALSEHGRFAALGAPTRSSDFWQLGFDASWEIDVWGRLRRLREGAAAAMEGAIYGREAARVMLSAEVARIYFELRGTQAQLDIAEQNLAIAERTLGLAESRERNGVATRFETSSARAQLASVKSLVPALTQRRNALMNALALLLGEAPRTLDAQLRESMPLPSLADRAPVGIPSELAQRRPDILRAEAQLHAATAAVGVAKADFYPRIALRGRIGVEAFEYEDLDSWDSRAFSVGPIVYLPIFQGGRLVQRLALNESRQRTAALSYRQTVLRAWHEVDNALDAWAAQQRQHAELLVSYEQNKQALQAAERGYQEGAQDYLAVLTAQQNVLASQTRLNASATNAALALVALFKSLGGGWNPDELD